MMKSPHERYVKMRDEFLAEKEQRRIKSKKQSEKEQAERKKKYQSAYSKAYRLKNRDAHAAYQKEWLLKLKGTPELARRRKKYGLKYKYGMTVESFNAILHAQGGVCAICGTSSWGNGTGKILEFPSVDHDHATGAVRGLLCMRCNAGIGSLRDDPVIIEKALNYLMRWHAARGESPAQGE
jgi:hypothetical protein